MKLFFRKLGQGPPLIILHGLYGSSDNWLGIARALSARFTIYLIDQRNHGHSPHDPVNTYQAMRDDLRDFMDGHDIWKTNLVGHSMGGKTAMFFAAAYPHRLISLVVVDISPRSYKSLSGPSPQVLMHMNIIHSLRSLDLEHLSGRTQAEEMLAETVPSRRVRQFLLKSLDRDREGRYRWRLNLDALANQLPAIMDGFSPEVVKKGMRITGFSVLFIRGEQSDYLQEEDITFASELFPSAVFSTIQGAGHWVHAEQPERFLEVIEKFYDNSSESSS